MKNLTKMTEQDKYPNFREVPKYTQQKNAAPANLPVADDSFFLNSNQGPQKEEVKIEEKATHEPTTDELKERLNKLLKGEI
jgi:hypothetical protein